MQIGAPVEWSSLPELAIKEVGIGRLRMRFPAAAGVAAHNRLDVFEFPVSRVFFDTELGVFCEPFRRGLNEPYRCLPLDTDEHFGNGTFADAQCQVAVATAHISSQSCEPPEERRFYLLDKNQFDGPQTIPLEFYEKGTPAQTPIYRKLGNDCSLLPSSDWLSVPLTPLDFLDLPQITEELDD